MRRCWPSLVVALLFLSACTGGPPDARVEVPRHDFGTLGQQTEVEHLFQVRNAGGAMLHLQEVRDTCPCTRSEILTRDVPAGGVGQVRTVFASSWFQDELVKSVYLTTNDPDQPQLELVVRAQVRVDLGVQPRVHHLGDVVAGEVATVSTWLSNHTDGTVAIVGIELPGDDVRVTGLPTAEISPERPLQLAAGQSLALELEALPGAGEGMYARKVLVRTRGTQPEAFPVLLMGRYEAE